MLNPPGTSTVNDCLIIPYRQRIGLGKKLPFFFRPGYLLFTEKTSSRVSRWRLGPERKTKNENADIFLPVVRRHGRKYGRRPSVRENTRRFPLTIISRSDSGQHRSTTNTSIVYRRTISPPFDTVSFCGRLARKIGICLFFAYTSESH